MKSKKAVLLPKEKKMLAQLGENLKLARRRRKLTSEQVAERANISRSTLWHVEKGSDHISIGIYLQVFSVLGMADDFRKLAADDILGRKLQDAQLITKKRIKK
jgi:transcriptional regulator with XRE-family HTH domain